MNRCAGSACRGDSVAAILVDRTGQTVLLVEQFRYRRTPRRSATDGSSKPSPAASTTGRLRSRPSAGRSPKRPDSRVSAVEQIGTFFVSPGGSSETDHPLQRRRRCEPPRPGRRAGPPRAKHPVGRVPPRPTRVNLIARVRDAKTLIGLMWLLAPPRLTQILVRSIRKTGPSSPRFPRFEAPVVTSRARRGGAAAGSPRR